MLYGLGTLGCLFAANIEQLIAWRFIQAFGGAATHAGLRCLGGRWGRAGVDGIGIYAAAWPEQYCVVTDKAGYPGRRNFLSLTMPYGAVTSILSRKRLIRFQRMLVSASHRISPFRIVPKSWMCRSYLVA